MRPPKTLLIGWDGADWEIARPLMEAGLMPCLASLVAGGVSGELTSVAPYLSPMLWTTIATGHHPDRHGVHGFAEVDPLTGEARAVGSASRRTQALWNVVSGQGGSAGVIGWMGSFPAERIHGVFVADEFAHAPANPSAAWPVPPGGVYPPSLAEELADLRLRPHEVDAGLLGLFVPALHTHRGEFAGDPHLIGLMQRLAQLYTVQNAAVAIVGRDQPDFCAVYFHFIDLICHEFVPYHPPRHPRVSTKDYERYQGVVAAAYRVQDALLGDLLRHCTPDTRVMLVSDHGFTTGRMRPEHTPRLDAGLAAWHRREGIAVASGPGVAAGRRFSGVRPHDIAPTLLTWMGLPRGEDMPGRVLDEMFTTVPEVSSIPSWGSHPGTVPPPEPPAIQPEEGERRRLTRRFVELGYLDPAAQKGRPGGELVIDENHEHVGTSLRDLGRPADALPHLQIAALADPESPTRAVELMHCLLDLGLAEEAEQAMQPFLDHGEDQPRALLLRTEVLINRRRFSQALKLIDRMADTKLSALCDGLRRLILLRSGRFDQAREAFRAETQRSPSRVPPLLGLAQACLWTGRHDEAITAARSVLSLDAGSVDARLLMEQATRCRDTGARTPALPGWDELAQSARTRLLRRTEFRERERAFVRARLARRSSPETGTTTHVASAPILVVSGAPRSGTSMLMRMLALAGVPVLTDGLRPADTNNPAGYFEWEPIKRISKEPALIAHAEGKAVKIVSALLADLPAGHDYEVIFMRRDARSIMQSQERMIDQTGAASVRLDAMEIERHIDSTLAQLRDKPRIRVLEMGYDDLLDRSEIAVARLVEFIGVDRIKRPGALHTAMNMELRHHLILPNARSTP